MVTLSEEHHLLQSQQLKWDMNDVTNEGFFFSEEYHRISVHNAIIGS